MTREVQNNTATVHVQSTSLHKLTEMFGRSSWTAHMPIPSACCYSK